MKQVAEKIYKEFFHQADILLKKNGKIVILCNLKDLVEKTKNHFIIKKKLEVVSGKESLNLYILTR
jgi:16S rRNA G1207 methylase RsmC